MAMSSLAKSIYIILIILSIFASQTLSESEECSSEDSNDCNDKAAAGPLKIIAIVTILISSIIGVCAPLLTKSVPALQPDKEIFVIVKLFAAGIILATGFMHVLPDSVEMLSSSCLPDAWQNFPFPFFVAMFSVLATLMIDSFATSFYSREPAAVDVVDSKSDHEICIDQESCPRAPAAEIIGRPDSKQLVRYRVIAMVLELGIIVHSVVIGLSLGASNNTCTIKSLVAAMCFHQMFEGMGLGGSILQAEFQFLKKAAMAFFFSVTTPFGIALGMALTKAYKENSPTSLITVGLLNAISAGLLIYMALVNLLAVEFMGPKLQGSTALQFKSIAAVSLGAAGMSVLAYWA